jgi:hypothetical protein
MKLGMDLKRWLNPVFTCALLMLTSQLYGFEREIELQARDVNSDTVQVLPRQIYVTRQFQVNGASLHAVSFLDRSSGLPVVSRAFERPSGEPLRSFAAPGDGEGNILLEQPNTFFGLFFEGASRAERIDLTAPAVSSSRWLTPHGGQVLQVNSEFPQAITGTLYVQTYDNAGLEFIPARASAAAWKIALLGQVRCLSSHDSVVEFMEVIYERPTQVIWQRRSLADGSMIARVELDAPAAYNGSCPVASPHLLYSSAQDAFNSSDFAVLRRDSLNTNAAPMMSVLEQLLPKTKIIVAKDDRAVFLSCERFGDESDAELLFAALSPLNYIDPSLGVARPPQAGEEGVATVRCRLIATNANLETLWERAFLDPVQALNVADAQLTVQSEKEVRAFDQITGELLWRYALDAEQSVRLSVQNRQLLWLESDRRGLTHSTLRIIDPRNGFQRESVVLAAKSTGTESVQASFQNGRWQVLTYANDAPTHLQSYQGAQQRYAVTLPEASYGLAPLTLQGKNVLAVIQSKPTGLISVREQATGAEIARLQLPFSFVLAQAYFGATDDLFLIGSRLCSDSDSACSDAPQLWRWRKGSPQVQFLRELEPGLDRFVDFRNPTPIPVHVGDDVLLVTRPPTGGQSLQRFDPILGTVIWRQVFPLVLPLFTPELNTLGIFATLERQGLKLRRLDDGMPLFANTVLPLNTANASIVIKPVDANRAVLAYRDRQAIEVAVFSLNDGSLLARQRLENTNTISSANPTPVVVADPPLNIAVANGNIAIALRPTAPTNIETTLSVLWLDGNTLIPLAEPVIAQQTQRDLSPRLRVHAMATTVAGIEMLWSGGKNLNRFTRLQSVDFPSNVFGNITVFPKQDYALRAEWTPAAVIIQNNSLSNQSVVIRADRETAITRCVSPQLLCPSALPAVVSLPPAAVMELLPEVESEISAYPIDASAVETSRRDNAAWASTVQRN